MVGRYRHAHQFKRARRELKFLRSPSTTTSLSEIIAAPRRKPRRVVAKVEWHPGELCPRVGFIVTNLARPAERIVAFYNHRGTCEQYIKEGKGAIKWTRLSCRSFAANAVRLQLHAVAYNLGNFMRTLVMPKTAEPWSLTSLRELRGTSTTERRAN